MTQATSLQSPGAEHYRQEYSRVADSLSGKGNARLAELRAQALEQFADKGFPDPRHEDWKYTNVRTIEKQAFVLAESGVAIDPASLEKARHADMDAYELVFVNGHFSAELSKFEGLPQGVTLSSLSVGLEQHADAITAGLARLASPELNGFVAFNTAFMSDGVFLELADNVELDRPVHLLFMSSNSEQALVAHPRVLIVAGKHSRCQVIEQYASEAGSRNLSNSVTEIIAAAGSRVEHCTVQNESEQAFHVGALFVDQQNDSEVISHSIALGARLSRQDIRVALSAPGARIELNGLYMVGGRQHVDHHTCVDHLQPNTHSDEYYKGILDGHSRGVFNGRVMVHRDAQKIEAHQHNRNMLLSDKAEVDTKPELEIYADDVKCSHGATVGQLDTQSLFYLRSRGIDEEAARNLLTFAFADDVISRIGIAPVRARLEEIVIGQLPDSDELKELI